MRLRPRSRGRLRVAILAAADALCVFLAGACAVWLYRAVGLGHYKFGASFYLRLWPACVSFVALNAAFRLYHGNLLYPASPVSPVEEFRRLACSAVATGAGVIVCLALAYQTTENYSRAVIVAATLSVCVFAQTFRDFVRWLLKRLDAAQIDVVLVGDGEKTSRLADSISKDAHCGFSVAAVLPSDSPDVVRTARNLGVRNLVSCQDMRVLKARMGEYSAWFSHIAYFPSADAFPAYGLHPAVFDGTCGFEMANQRRMGAIRVEKRILDTALALAAFVLLLPFFIAIPVLVKLTSKGPVFYRQKRTGKNGRMLRVWKFRSMYADADERLKKILETDPARKAEWEANFKLSDDPRVTPLGRFMRKTSIDEFPQLFNVFAGDMALVGPRPIVEAEIPLYGRSYQIYASVEPGITGLWQASGRSDTDYARRVALDVYYAMNWSPWLDLWILKKTFSAVFLMRGAR